MKVFIRIVIFSVLISMAYWGFSNYGIPQIIPEPPPVEEQISGSMTVDQYIALGGKIFNGKGTCTLCHNPVGGRAPLLIESGKDGAPIGARAADRLKDPQYKGKAKTAEEYIHESMVEPSAFVIAGYGKPGTNDSESPMPNVSKGSIGLNEAEIGAVIAYLQKSAGVQVTVKLPTGPAPIAAAAPAEPQSAKTPEEAIAKHGCTTCHKIPGIEEAGDVGPDLTGLSKRAGKTVKGLIPEQYIMQSILTPDAYTVKGFEPGTMPADLGEKMTVKELDMIIKYLLEKKG
ncbi:MAG: c-type cytochrome [Nitrospinae bacterium]|nr:c-type cytochrome [Nitrospinota bacterium]MBI3813794.1 c-type cytochrome [Nitrospinota bacterium]